jgi:hypothetical protein
VKFEPYEKLHATALPFREGPSEDLNVLARLLNLYRDGYEKPSQRSIQMDAKSIGSWQRARPFRPFILHLTSGETIEVAHKENLGFAPDTPVLLVYGGEEGITMIDHDAVASITHRDKLTRKKDKS